MITLTTDFGLTDHYVGTMKGVILSRCPGAQIVDISHGIPAFSILSGAYAIGQAAPYFPAETVHVVVVDPGVGTARRAIAARVDGQTFIAPDNGVLSMILKRAHTAEIRDVVNEKLFLRPVSSTFHGRDIFAPVAAALELGKQFDAVGPLISDATLLAIEPEATGSVSWQGVVLSVDQFGNIITNFAADLFTDGPISIGAVNIENRCETFGEAPKGTLFLYTGSSGFIEVGLNRGSAAAELRVGPGDAVSLSRGQ